MLHWPGFLKKYFIKQIVWKETCSPQGRNVAMERLSQQSCLHRIGSLVCSILLLTVLSFPSLAWGDSNEATSPDIAQDTTVAQTATGTNDVSQTTNGDALGAAQTAQTTTDVATHVSASTDLPTGNLTIMHTNDIHGRYKDENGSIGFATLKKMAILCNQIFC